MVSPDKIKFAAQKAAALTVKCSYCNAEPGQPCRNTITAAPLQYAAAHTPRLLDSIKTPPENGEVPF